MVYILGFCRFLCVRSHESHTIFNEWLWKNSDIYDNECSHIIGFNPKQLLHGLSLMLYILTFRCIMSLNGNDNVHIALNFIFLFIMFKEDCMLRVNLIIISPIHVLMYTVSWQSMLNLATHNFLWFICFVNMHWFYIIEKLSCYKVSFDETNI